VWTALYYSACCT